MRLTKRGLAASAFACVCTGLNILPSSAAIQPQPAVQLNTAFPDDQNVQDFLVSGDNRWVVYLAGMDADGPQQLFSRPISGSDWPIQLNGPLPKGGNVEQFLLAPNGSRVVYRVDQEKDGVFELYSQPLDGTLAGFKINGKLTPGGWVTDFLISPDSQWIVYSADQERAGVVEIYSSPLSGSVLKGPNKINGAFPNNATAHEYPDQPRQQASSVFGGAGPGRDD